MHDHASRLQFLKWQLCLSITHYVLVIWSLICLSSNEDTDEHNNDLVNTVEQQEMPL